VIGGEASGSVYKNDAWYSTDGINWTQATANAGWAGRYELASAVFQNKVWVTAGYANGTDKNDVWYSADGANWTQAPNAQWIVRRGPSSVVFDNKLWILGGFPELMNDVWYSFGINGIEDNCKTSVANCYLFNAEPNPFKTNTAIRYSLTFNENVLLKIYDVSGKLIRTLIDQNQTSGIYSINWNGKDNKGITVRNGIYLYRLKTGNEIKQRQIILVK
jgi:hypothetical protein